MDPSPPDPLTLKQDPPACAATKQCIGWCQVCNHPTSNLPLDDLAAITKRIPYISRTDLIVNENELPVWTGAHCEIRKAFWDDKEVVLKRFDDEDHFAEELQIYNRHQDMCILRFYGVVAGGAEPAGAAGTLVFQYAQKGNLQDLIETEELKAMPFQSIAQIGYEIANGLDFLHSFGDCAHGALNCKNVLIDEHYNVNIIGFGRSRSTEVPVSLQPTKDGDGDGDDDRLTQRKKQQDIYNLGVILLELGIREPFAGDINEAKVAQALERLKDSGRAPPKYTDLIARCFSTDFRHQSSLLDIIDTLNTLHQAEDPDAVMSDNIFDAIRASSVAALEWFLSQGGDPNLEEVDENGNGKPLICLICELPSPSTLLDALFRHQKGKICNINTLHTFYVGRRFYINTPIFQVIRGEEPYRALEILSQNGANLSTTDKRGRSIVHAICERFKSDTDGIIQMFDLLARHRYNFNRSNDNGLRETSLHEIAHYCAAPLEPMKFLVSKGVADINLQSWHGTVLHTVAHYCENSLEVAKWLVDDHKLDVNTPNQEKLKPLQLAVMRRGQMEMVKFLISKGATVFDKFQSFAKEGGRTDVLSLAAKRGNLEVVKYLLATTRQYKTTKAFLTAEALDEARRWNQKEAITVIKDWRAKTLKIFDRDAPTDVSKLANADDGYISEESDEEFFDDELESPISPTMPTPDMLADDYASSSMAKRLSRYLLDITDHQTGPYHECESACVFCKEDIPILPATHWLDTAISQHFFRLVPWKELTKMTAPKNTDVEDRTRRTASWRGTTVAISMPSRISDIIEQVQSSNLTFRILNGLKNFRRLHSCDHIAAVYAITQDPRNRHYCLVMQNATRGSLRQYMKASEYLNFPWNVKCKVAWELTTGLKFLHDGGIVHGDLNSLNVLITESGSAIVTGFGHSINHTSLLATSHIHGQVAYTAPEILKYAFHKDAHIYPPHQPNELCDIYSLGVLLWEIAAGCPPFVEYANDSNQLLIRIVEDDLREMSDITDDTQYTTLYQRAWSTLPENRPQLTELVECLDNLRQPNIFSACRAGDIQALAWYISHGRNVDARDKYGTGVLDAVCEASDPIPLLRWLLATKVDVVNHGWRAISSVCNYSTSVESLKLLFSAGATVIPRPPHLEPPLTELCANIEVTSIVETIKLLVATLGVKIVNETDSNGETTLVKLITYRPFDINALQFLLKYRANANAVDADGAPILFTALREENGVELIEQLVLHGANTHAKDDRGRSLLHILFDDESVWTNEPDWRKSDLTAVLKMIDVLISYGSGVNSRDADGNTPMFYLLGRAPFTSQEIDAFVERLIVEHRADVNATNNRGDNVLHVLLGNGWSKSRQNQHGRSIKNVFKLLLSKGADPSTRNNEGLTILHCLYRRPRDFSDEARLITTTAMAKNVDLNAQEYKYGWTALFMAANSYSKSLSVDVYHRAKVLEYLLGMGAEVSITDMSDRTVWAQLISNPHTDTNSMRVLLSHEAKVTFKDEYNHIIPVMHHVATTSNKPLDDLEYIAELLGTIPEQNSVEDMLNVAPWRSGTALHALVKRESDFSKAAIFLLKRGANPATLAPFKPIDVGEDDLELSVVHVPHSSTPDDGIWVLPGEIIGDALTIAANRGHLQSVKAILELCEECRNLECLRRAITFARGKKQADICQYLEAQIDYEGEYY